MKKLQIIKKKKNFNTDELAGFCLKDEKVIAINLENLWNYSRTEDGFIKLFSKYFTHEWLHIYLWDIKEGTNFGEEKTIRLLLNQSFSKKDKAYYRNAYKE